MTSQEWKFLQVLERNNIKYEKEKGGRSISSFSEFSAITLGLYSDRKNLLQVNFFKVNGYDH